MLEPKIINQLISQNDKKGIETIINKAVQERPGDLENLSIIAHILETNNILNSSEKLSTYILKHDNNFLPTIITLGTIHRKRQNYKSSEDLYNRGIALDPNCYSAWFNLGTLKEFNKDFNSAIFAYQKCEQIRPCSISKLRLGVCQQQLNNHQEAIKEINIYLETNNKDLKALYHLAISYQAQNLNIKAQNIYETILLEDASHTEAQHSLATIHAANKNYDLAISGFMQVLKIMPNHQEAMHNLASVYYHLRKYKKALDYWLKQMEVKPDRHTYYNIGSCYIALQQHLEAEPYLLKACQENPEDVNSIINLASIYIKTENWNEVVKLYKHALKIEPENESIKYVLSALEQSGEHFKKAPKAYVKDLFDQYANSFESHLLKNLKYSAHVKISEIINEHIDHSKKYKFLDLGCGTGLCGNECKTWASKLVGVDLSTAMLVEAKKRSIYDELHEEEIEKYLESSETFDIIVGADVFPYIGDILHTIELCYKILSKSGLLAFTLEETNAPNIYNLAESGRYQHNTELLREKLKKDWEILEYGSVTTRTQNHAPVSGKLIMLRKKSP